MIELSADVEERIEVARARREAALGRPVTREEVIGVLLALFADADPSWGLPS